MRTSRCVVAACALWGTSAVAQTFVVGFDGVNEGGWSFGYAAEVRRPSGGNPGAYLRAQCVAPGLCLDTFYPTLRTTQPSSQFHGDYRNRGVTHLGMDGRLFYIDFQSPRGFLMSLVLINDNSTPANPGDDLAVYLLGDEVPQIGGGWKSFSFDVPSASTTIPPAWRVLWSGALSPDDAWNRVMTDVSEVRFVWADPETFAIFQNWEPGADNIWVRTTPGCYADCDSSTGPGVLDIFDFLCFQNRFAAGGTYACDCDTSAGPGVCDIFDFLCFQNAFAAGCP